MDDDPYKLNTLRIFPGPLSVPNLSSVNAQSATSISPPLNMCIFFSLSPTPYALSLAPHTIDLAH